MVAVISFPFRLATNGGIAVVDQDSDPAIEEDIAVALLTRPGERVQAPTFGVADPAFSGFEVGALQRHLLDFGPPIDIVSATVVPGTGDGTEAVRVEWKRQDTPRQGGPA